MRRAKSGGAAAAVKQQAQVDVVDGLLVGWRRRFPDWDLSGYQIAGRMGDLIRKQDARLEAVSESHGLNPFGFTTLATLAAAGDEGLTPTDLVEGMCCPSGTVTHRLNQLEGAGLLRREVDPQDRRSYRIQLTPAGLARLEACAADYLPSLQRTYAVLSREERKTLEALLRKMGAAQG